MRRSAILAVACAALAACGALGRADPAPDFHLTDLNSSSTRYGTAVSPRDYRLQIAAFYFGEAG